MEKICPKCNTKFNTDNKIKKFCSKQCMNYYHSKKAALNLIIKRRDDNKICAICGQNEYPINVVHHIKSRFKGGADNPNNLITVCPNCHEMIHKNIIIFSGDGEDGSNNKTKK